MTIQAKTPLTPKFKKASTLLRKVENVLMSRHAEERGFDLQDAALLSSGAIRSLGFGVDYQLGDSPRNRNSATQSLMFVISRVASCDGMSRKRPPDLIPNSHTFERPRVWCSRITTIEQLVFDSESTLLATVYEATALPLVNHD